jgi:hypothetical protein
MKKQAARKLTLSTETVMKLGTDDLGAVHGGITPGLFMASVRFCMPVAQLALGSAQTSCITCRCRR